MNRSTHLTCTIETRTGLPQWRWTRVPVPLPTSELVRCQWTRPCIRDTSLDDVHGVTRNLASALCCGVTAVIAEDIGRMPCWTLACLWPRQPDLQQEEDEAERDHDQGPPGPTHEQIARVAEGHHQRRSQAQAPTQSLRLLNTSHTAPGSSPASPLPSRSSPPYSPVVGRHS